MNEPLHFPESAAAGYDDHVGQYTAKLVPRLLEIARLKPGQSVLDVATGTGIAALAAAEIVGASGRITATDISPYMLDHARQRMASVPNSSFSIEDGQALSFVDQSFDAVICNMGLMYFPDPGKGVQQFYRVLRKNGRATVSVFNGSGAVYRLSSGREFQAVSTMISTLSPGNARHGANFRNLGVRLATLYVQTGFSNIDTEAYSGLLLMSSLDGYVQSIEAGAGSAGAEFLAAPTEIREAVRAELKDLLRESKGEKVQVIVPVMFVSGVR